MKSEYLSSEKTWGLQGCMCLTSPSFLLPHHLITYYPIYHPQTPPLGKNENHWIQPSFMHLPAFNSEWKQEQGG